MNNRFSIERIMVAGKDLKPAILTFSLGTNLIVGPSDTGKSYIFQCINYLLGGEDCPKDIPEAKGYTHACIEIKTSTGLYCTISRELKNNSKAYFSETTIENHNNTKKSIGIKSNTHNGNNISELLLDLMGINDIFIKKNGNNQTRKLSFRDITQLTLIDEERIITETSPIYSSKENYYKFTLEQSVFKFLLTKGNDGELTEIEEKKIRESRIKGKIELIDGLISSKNEVIEALQKSLLEIDSIDINNDIKDLIKNIEDSSQKIEKLSEEREIYYLECQTKKSERLRSSELLKRFSLLQKHYKNDLNRLNFIQDGEFLFSQLNTKICPVCGIIMDEEHLEHLSHNIDTQSINVEAQKIELKIKDLEDTITSVLEEIDILNNEVRLLEHNLELIENSLNHELLPLRQNFQEKLKNMRHYLGVEQEIKTTKKDIENYYIKRNELEIELNSKQVKEIAGANIEYNVLHDLCKTIESLLKLWNYPNLTTVEFDSSHKIYDLMISGRKRNSHGKGVRALSYTAFTLGLLDFCLQKQMPHPGLAVLDSPLTTYHKGQEKEEDDEIEKDMQESFFKYLSEIGDDRQIIILDNKMPPNHLIPQINFIQFSENSKSTRRGFFPKF